LVCKEGYWKNKTKSKETREKISKAHIGKKHPHSKETKRKISKANSGKYKGKDSPNWNPNKTDEERKIKRNISGMGKWKSDVKDRDNYTCQCCGFQGFKEKKMMVN
jgi:hypothetical protein